MNKLILNEFDVDEAIAVEVRKTQQCDIDYTGCNWFDETVHHDAFGRHFWNSDYLDQHWYQFQEAVKEHLHFTQNLLRANFVHSMTKNGDTND